ncbi:MAG: NADH-quinone oxidoreductase subunit J [Candidatus Rokubacteria bacterium]|nr:NADH-quinone oxidoreductase subunit J [Candidatus Rokubacteria bacterium]
MGWVAFLIVGGCAIVCAVGLVVRPNPLHGALFLVGNLFCVAVLYLMLRAEFLALVQVIVYAGAIMVLFLFAIFLLVPRRVEVDSDPLGRQRMLALPFAGLLGLAVVLVLPEAGTRLPSPGPPVPVRTIGQLLLTDYLFPFEVTSVLLLAALIGALVLAKRPAG